MFANPLTEYLNADARKAVLERFPELAAKGAGCLAVSDYFINSPARYFNADAHRELYTWLSDPVRHARVLAEVRDHAASIDRALRALADVNRLGWHEDPLGPEVEQLRLLDDSVHPAYLRLTEAVLHGLLLVPARLMRQERQAPTPANFEIRDVVAEASAGGLPLTCVPYNRTHPAGPG